MLHGRFSVCVALAMFVGASGVLRANAAADEPADSYARLVSEYTEQQDAMRAAVAAAKTEAETDAAWKMMPDLTVFSRRALKIAEAKPQDAASRDALLWIVHQPGQGFPKGERGEIEQKAVQMLLAQYSDDVEVARVALLLNVNCWINRERLMQGLVDRAVNPETRALARLALARYWMEKMEKAEHCQQPDAPTKSANADYAETYADLRACDIPATRVKAEALLNELIVKHGDVAFVRGAEKRELDQQRGETVRTVAEALLGELQNFVVGKPAPAIDGKDLDGAPLKLADFRGKVVVIVFWASWCGPCMEEVPHELELIAKYKDEPFALVGVCCDEDLAAGRQALAEHHISWRNWHDPISAASIGPIVRSYSVRSLPGVFVIDAQGVLRAKHCRGERLDKAIDEVLKEQKAQP